MYYLSGHNHNHVSSVGRGKSFSYTSVEMMLGLLQHSHHLLDI